MSNHYAKFNFNLIKNYLVGIVFNNKTSNY